MAGTDFNMQNFNKQKIRVIQLAKIVYKDIKATHINHFFCQIPFPHKNTDICFNLQKHASLQYMCF